MDTFNNDAARGDDVMTGTDEDILSNEQMNYAPKLNNAQQTEYSDLQDFDFTQYLGNDETAKEVQTESAAIDPRLLGPLSNQGQERNDSSNSGIYNDMSVLDPNQGIYNAGDLLVDTTYQPNIVHPFQYQQNQMADNLLQQNRLKQQLLEQKIEEQKIQQQKLLQNPFGLDPLQLTPLQQNFQQNFEQNPYQDNFQQISNLDLQQPQPINALRPQVFQEEGQLAERLDSATLSYFEEGQEYFYHNEILNRFEEPAAALRIIDQLEYPFTASLQNALEQEASRLEDFNAANTLESASKTETKPKVGRRKNNNSSKISKTPAKVPKNKRRENQERILAVAARMYKDIPTKPSSWGPINPDTGRPTFEYTEHGELTLGQKFTPAQISDYLAFHPCHGILPTGEPDTKNSGLKLWIQYAGADSNTRYPSPEKSNKCRFANCTRETFAIQKGEPRICFDEQRFPDFPTNPFHNAGYVHLYCFEKEFDFPQLCKDFNISPDTRAFAKGDVNRCAITKDHPEMAKIVDDFISNSKPWAQFNEEGIRPEAWYPESLSSKVVEYHLKHQPRTAQTARDKRGGNSIDGYKGDLELWLRIEQERKAEKASAPKRSRGQKRKLEDVKEDEDMDADGSDEEDILDEEILERPIKRTRRS